MLVVQFDLIHQSIENKLRRLKLINLRTLPQPPSPRDELVCLSPPLHAQIKHCCSIPTQPALSYALNQAFCAEIHQNKLSTLPVRWSSASGRILRMTPSSSFKYASSWQGRCTSWMGQGRLSAGVFNGRLSHWRKFRPDGVGTERRTGRFGLDCTESRFSAEEGA
jgi:hypothetical protein